MDQRNSDQVPKDAVARKNGWLHRRGRSELLRPNGSTHSRSAMARKPPTFSTWRPSRLLSMDVSPPRQKSVSSSHFSPTKPLVLEPSQVAEKTVLFVLGAVHSGSPSDSQYSPRLPAHLAPEHPKEEEEVSQRENHAQGPPGKSDLSPCAPAAVL